MASFSVSFFVCSNFLWTDVFVIPQTSRSRKTRFVSHAFNLKSHESTIDWMTVKYFLTGLSSVWSHLNNWYLLNITLTTPLMCSCINWRITLMSSLSVSLSNRTLLYNSKASGTKHITNDATQIGALQFCRLLTVAYDCQRRLNSFQAFTLSFPFDLKNSSGLGGANIVCCRMANVRLLATHVLAPARSWRWRSRHYEKIFPSDTT